MNKIIISLVIFTLAVFLSGCNNPNISFNDGAANQKDFKWGTGFDPYPNAQNTDEVLKQVISRAKELDIKWVKFGIPQWDDENFSTSTKVVEQCQQTGLRVVLGFQPTKSFLDYSDPYQAGYDQAYKIARKFPSIQYFQIANEPASAAIKENWPGVDAQSFEQQKYQKVLKWLEGASAGVKKANRGAKKIITGHWTHVGFFKMLAEDKLDYDIIGWDWHQESPDLTKIDSQGKNLDLIEELKKLDKELWMTEAGIVGGSSNGEDKQADYLNKLANQVYNSQAFSGFFTFMLYDNLPRAEKNENNLGLVKLIQDDNGNWQLGQPKKAFEEYKNIILGK